MPRPQLPAHRKLPDPIFGRPLNFYLFTLPAWQLIVGWLLTLAVLTLHPRRPLFPRHRRLARAQRTASQRDIRFPGADSPSRRRIPLLVLALRVYLGRFELLFEHHTIFDGVTYTDAHVTLTGMLFVCAALLLGAFIAVVSALFSPRGRWLVIAVVPAVVCYVAVAVVGWYVTSFLVKPNELVREAALHRP